MLYVHIGIASMRQFQCVQTTFVIEYKENYLKFTLIKNHVHCVCLFQTSQAANQYQNICHYMANC